MGPCVNTVNVALAVYDYLGCWKDTGNDNFLSNIGSVSHSKDQSSSLHQCAKAAFLRGIPVFGIRNNSACVGSVHASLTYMRYGPSTQCYNGTGGPRSMDVYSMDGKKIHRKLKNSLHGRRLGNIGRGSSPFPLASRVPQHRAPSIAQAPALRRLTILITRIPDNEIGISILM